MSQADTSSEILYQQIQRLGDRELQAEYLNQLQWTEPIAQILPLVDNETALRVVKLALEVDLCLGAKLAGAVKPELQSTTVDWVISTEVSPAFLFNLVGITGSDAAIPFLVKVANEEENAFYAIHALGEIGTETAVEAAILALTDIYHDARKNFQENKILSVIYALEKIGTEAAVELLIEIMNNEKLHPQGDGVFGHGEWGIGHGEEITNDGSCYKSGNPPIALPPQCPMPQAAGRLSLSTHKGMEFPAAFNEEWNDYDISGTCVEAAEALANINSESGRQALMRWCLKYFDWTDFSSTAADR